MIKRNKLRKSALSAVLAASMVVGNMSMFPLTAKAEENADETIQQQFYVATNGDDKNDGSKEHPFATVEQARKAVDEINDKMTGDIIVNIGSGDYYVTETIEMDKEDSGTNGHEVIYRCEGEPGSARLIGGKKVSGWTKTTSEDTAFDLAPEMVGKVYKLELEENTPEFNTMYVNGRRAEMARTMNREDNERFPLTRDTYMSAAGGSAWHINYPATLPQEAVDGIVNALARGEEGAQVFAWDADYRNWFSSTLPVSAIDTASRKLSFPKDPENPAANRPKYAFGSGARFFLQGNLAFLDVPGEYHYNKKEQVLYYYPKAGEENLDEQEIIVPWVQEIFSLKGDEKEAYNTVPNPESMVHNITFEGFEAGYTEFVGSYSYGWNAVNVWEPIGSHPEEAKQEGITLGSQCENRERKEFRKGIFSLYQTHHITLDSMRIVNAGLVGVNVDEDNNDITIQNSEIGYAGLHGISIDGGYPGPETGKYSYNQLVTNNVIHDVGELEGHGTGLQILQTHDSEFSHMEMYNSGRRAIYLIGGYAVRKAAGAIDSNFNRYRDAATYENKLEYLYLHDLQQEGGDDGAIFICTLYGSWGDKTGSKPNYLNQVYMDKIGSSPSNNDFTPNCINFDMGCQGMQVSNVKAVNPQHYNLRYDQNTNHVKFDNVNLAYYHMESSEAAVNYQNFDESKMEYDKIGVGADFPYKDAVSVQEEKSYDDLYYREEFDNGLDDWWSLAGKPEITPVYYSPDAKKAGNSFEADAFYDKSAEGCRIGKPFGRELNKVVEIDFFDHSAGSRDGSYCGMKFQWKMDSFARVDDGMVQRGIGVDHNTNANYYSYRLGSMTKATDIPREYGWHTFKWDYTSGTDVKMYIDNKLIAEAPASSFNYVEMGDYGMGGFNAYDNVVIYGGDAALPPMELPEPPVPETPEEELRTLPGKVEAETTDRKKGSGQPTYLDTIDVTCMGHIDAPGAVYEYDLDVTEAMTEPLTVQYAANNEAKIRVTIGDQTQDLVLPATGGYRVFTPITTENFTLSPGKTTLKVEVLKIGLNLDWYSMGKVEEEKPVSVEKIVPAVKDTLVLNVGNTAKVPVQILPDNAANKAVVWSTDAEETVITVAEDGMITANGVGEAVVTAASQGNPEVKATFKVEVRDAETSLISTTEKGCVPTVSTCHSNTVNYSPAHLIDGKLNTEWACAGDATKDPKPTATLTWDEPQTVKEVWVYDRAITPNYAKVVEVYFNDETTPTDVTGQSNDGKTPGKLVLDTPRTDVTSVRFVLDREKTGVAGGLGLSEVKVFSDTPGEIPVSGIALEKYDVTLMKGDSYTFVPPVVVPASASNSTVEVAVENGEDVVSLKANITVDGVLKGYTVTALNAGNAVIRVNAANGVYTDLKVSVGDRTHLGNKITEAETLLGQYSGSTEVHKALKEAIDQAMKVYKESEDLKEYAVQTKKLEEAMKVFKEAVISTETAEDVVNGLTLVNPAKGDTVLQKPVMKTGFRVSIASVNPEDVIRNNWSIRVPEKDTTVEVTLRVTKLTDGTYADKVFAVTVPGVPSEPEKQEFEVTVDGETTIYLYNTEVTITAPEKEGMKFAGWEVDGKIVSYKTTYRFYVSGEMTFTSTYVENAAEVKEEVKAMLTNTFTIKRADGKSDVRFVGELALPEGYTVLEAGLVWSSKDHTKLVVDGELNPELKPTCISKISDTNQFSVTIKGMPKDRFLRGVIFAKVADEDGNEIYIFSAEKKVYAAK